MGMSQSCIHADRLHGIKPEVVTCTVDPLCEGMSEVSKCHDEVIRRTPAWRNHQLLAAARDGDDEAMRSLIADRANLETRRPFCISPQAPVDSRSARANQGMTPLMLTALGGYSECTRVLVEARADVNAEEEEGLRPLHFGAKALSLEICRILLEAQAIPDKSTDNGETAEDLALMQCPSPRSCREWRALFQDFSHNASFPGSLMDVV
mmetsp:Transcript_66019/g.123116  ORF Transcript_66019/g.123116 Transcript_66019/m.123116 type:complete len:208 (-) Transcript_66019:68-691(-)